MLHNFDRLECTVTKSEEVQTWQQPHANLLVLALVFNVKSGKQMDLCSVQAFGLHPRLWLLIKK